MTKAQEKEHFFGQLDRILNICMFCEEGKLKEGEVLQVADAYKQQYKMTADLLEEMRTAARNVRKSNYYRRATRPIKSRVTTLEDKAKSSNYSNCEMCDNIVKTTYQKTHKLNVCCAANQLKKELGRTNYAVHKKYNKATQLLNMYIRVCLFNTHYRNNLRNGAYWKTICLVQYNYGGVSAEP